MALMGFREYARHRKCTLRAVQKALEAKRITAIGEGRHRKIDSDAADKAWRLNTDPAAQSLLYSAGPNASVRSEGGLETAAGAGAVHQAAPASKSAPEDDEPEVGAQSDLYRENRGERERIRREREQLELDQLRGSLVPLAEAQRMAFTAFRSLRDAAANVAARVKDRCAAMTDSFAIEQLIDAEISAVFQKFDPEALLVDAADADEAG